MSRMYMLNQGVTTSIVAGALMLAGWVGYQWSRPVSAPSVIVFDMKNGCQYLTTPAGGLFPRLNLSGKHICPKLQDRLPIEQPGPI